MNDKQLIEALRRKGKMSGKNTLINKAADRLAELTQPQPIETALKSEHVLLFGGELHDDETGEVYQNDSCVIAYRDYSMWHLRFGDVLVVNPTHWLPCVKVDPASLGGQVDEE